MKKDEAVGKHVKNLPFVNSYPKMTDNIIAVLEKQEILEDKIKYKRKGSSKSDNFNAKFVPTALKNGEKVLLLYSRRLQKNRTREVVSLRRKYRFLPGKKHVDNK